MIDRNTLVIGLYMPDMNLARFQQILKDAGSPASGSAKEMYDAVVAEGVSPAFFLGLFWEESKLATDPKSMVVEHGTFNPGNTRSSRIGVTNIIPTERGPFVKYDSWGLGARDAAHRLIDPNFDYAKAGATTIGAIIPIWAPKADGNNPAGYINTVISLMNNWIGESSTNMEIIDLSNNTPNSVYTDRGFAISELILHDTAGQNDNNKASPSVCQIALDATIRWFQGSGGVSIHYLIGPENLGGKIYRLCKEEFAAYHAVGNKGSINGVSKDNRIAIGIERFGQPNEPVGPNQKAAMLWLVGDITNRYGLPPGAVISHMSIQADRRDGNVLLAAARAVVGVNHVTTENQGPKPAKEPSMLINNHVLAHGMLDYWNKVAVPGVQHPLGLPISEEKDWTSPDGKKLVVQAFERAVLGYDESIADPAYRVQGLIVGPEWVKNHLIV